MKKLLFTLTLALSALCSVTFTACEKKAETPGEQLDNAIENSNSAAKQFTKKAEKAAEDFNASVDQAIKDMDK